MSVHETTNFPASSEAPGFFATILRERGQPDGSSGVFANIKYAEELNRDLAAELVVTPGKKLVDFEFKHRSHGCSLTGPTEGLEHRLAHIYRAKRNMADAVVTVCQLNVEAHQSKIKKRYGDDVTIPNPHFTELIGMALGLPSEALGLHKLLVPISWEVREKAFAAREPAAA